MYLTARRVFPPDSPVAAELTSLAGTTIDELRRLALLDPYEHETALYLSRWDFDSEDERERANAVVEAAGMTPFTTERSCGSHIGYADDALYVDVTTIYWRKTNSVHAWFVENVQNGIDECEEHEVHAEQLAKLRSDCTDALAAYNVVDLDKAEKIMSPRAGFFFGSTEIDQWWVEDLKRTVTEIERVIRLMTEPGMVVRLFYRSSW